MLHGLQGSVEDLQDWLAGTLVLAYLGGFIVAVEFALGKLAF
jgi:hypothetical protein